jgi:hypothetical protein
MPASRCPTSKGLVNVLSPRQAFRRVRFCCGCYSDSPRRRCLARPRGNPNQSVCAGSWLHIVGLRHGGGYNLPGFYATGRRANDPRQGSCGSHRGNRGVAATSADVLDSKLMVRLVHLDSARHRSIVVDCICSTDGAPQRAARAANPAAWAVHSRF